MIFTQVGSNSPACIFGEAVACRRLPFVFPHLNFSVIPTKRSVKQSKNPKLSFYKKSAVTAVLFLYFCSDGYSFFYFFISGLIRI